MLPGEGARAEATARREQQADEPGADLSLDKLTPEDVL